MSLYITYLLWNNVLYKTGLSCLLTPLTQQLVSFVIKFRGEDKILWMIQKARNFKSTTNKCQQMSILFWRTEEFLTTCWMTNVQWKQKGISIHTRYYKRSSFNEYSLFDFTQHIKIFDIFTWLWTNYVAYKHPILKGSPI